jgi:hypothetical protein
VRSGGAVALVAVLSVAPAALDPCGRHDVASTPASLGTVRAILDCTSKGHAISPLVYGIAANVDTADRRPWELHVSSRRWGGNPTTRYNWELGNAWNTASDWFFRNVDYSRAPGYSYRVFLDDSREHGASWAFTVPTIGWVAKDTTSYSFPVSLLGPQQATAPEDADIGNGLGRDDRPLTPLPPSQTSIAAPPESIGRFVSTIRAHEEARGGGQRTYILDNEPMLWHATHRDVHPEPVSYDELLTRTIAFGSAVRAADPEALIAGPAEWGWPAYFSSAADTASRWRRLVPWDKIRNGFVALLPWLLR